MDRRWEVGRIGGVPVFVTPTWLLFVALIAYAIYGSDQLRLVSDSERLMVMALGTVLFFGGVAVHEGAHALAARRYGLPVLGVTFVFWGGYTETPSASRGPLRHFVISIVGPLSTLAIAGVYWVIAQATGGTFASVVLWLAALNALFAVVNAAPALPLDGGHALSAVVWGISGSRRTADLVTGYTSLAIGVALVAGGLLSLQTRGSWWLIMLFIGFQMIVIGRGTPQRVALRERLSAGRVRDAMRPPVDTVPADLSLAEALDRHLRGTEGRVFPVTDHARVVGTLSMRTARPIGARNPMRPVRAAMVPIGRSITLTPDLGLDEALERIGAYEAMVLDREALVGVLGPRDIQRWLDRGAPVGAGAGGWSAEVPPPPGATGVPPRPDRAVGGWE